MILAFCGLLGGISRAQTTSLLSTGLGGALGNDTSSSPRISADGRYVAFFSYASNLVASDTNGLGDVFVRDLASATTELVSVSTAGLQGNAHNGLYGVAISGDGRFIAFVSNATNLLASGANGLYQVFLRDRLAGTTEIVSISSSGAQGNGDSGRAVGLSISVTPDGRFVAFDSFANNLVPVDNNVLEDVFVRDRVLGTTSIASVSTSGVQGNLDSGFQGVSMSDDGRFVVFESTAFTLVPGDTNLVRDVFVRDRVAGTTVRASVTASGTEANDWSSWPTVSANGRFVSFVSKARTLVPGDTNEAQDIFVRDLQLGTTERVSVGPGGAESLIGTTYPSAITPDGRFVTFQSVSWLLVPGDANNETDIFVRDRVAGTTELVSLGPNGVQSDRYCANPTISADGRFIVFWTNSTTLDPADMNYISDVYLRDRGPTLVPATFCFGDGSGTACPCNNAGTVGRGCANSLDPGGARLDASGSPSIAADTLLLSASAMPESSTLYFQGTTRIAAGAGALFGDGLRCVAGAIVRLGTKPNVGGSSHFPSGADPAVSVKGSCSAGDVREYQAWYRNAIPFCTPATFNLTNGVEVVWMP